MLGRRPTGLDQILARGDKVIEYILLVRLRTCRVPGLTLLATATQVGQR